MIKLLLFETIFCFRDKVLTLLQTNNQTFIVKLYLNEATIARICRMKKFKQTASTN